MSHDFAICILGHYNEGFFFWFNLVTYIYVTGMIYCVYSQSIDKH